MRYAFINHAGSASLERHRLYMSGDDMNRLFENCQEVYEAIVKNSSNLQHIQAQCSRLHFKQIVPDWMRESGFIFSRGVILQPVNYDYDQVRMTGNVPLECFVCFFSKDDAFRFKIVWG